jgi:UDP:flavonoid glycosyltransferase YjiC (YdhE family)
MRVRCPGPADRLALLPYRDTVHLSLGTIFNRQPAAFDAALAGLRALPVNVVVTTGTDADPATLVPQPPHVLVERYLPHASLLGHCAAMVSHAGAATMLAGYRHGLPQVFLPRGGDQFDNAGAAVRAGAALRLTPDEADAATVTAATAATGRVLGEPGFAAAARRIQAEIGAMPDAEDVLPGLVWETEHRWPAHPGSRAGLT